MVAKRHSPVFKAAVAFGAQVLTGGLWALISPDTLSKAAPFLIIGGALIVALAFFWDELREYTVEARSPSFVHFARHRGTA
jgi:hypothetical protein